MTSNICQEIRRYGPRRDDGSSLAAAAIGQCGQGSYGVWMCVLLALHERTATLQ